MSASNCRRRGPARNPRNDELVCWIAPPDDGEAPGRSRSDVRLCVNAVSRAPAFRSSRRGGGPRPPAATRGRGGCRAALALGDEPVGARLVALGFASVLGRFCGCGRIVGAVRCPTATTPRRARRRAGGPRRSAGAGAACSSASRSAGAFAAATSSPARSRLAWRCSRSLSFRSVSWAAAHSRVALRQLPRRSSDVIPSAFGPRARALAQPLVDAAPFDVVGRPRAQARPRGATLRASPRPSRRLQ